MKEKLWCDTGFAVTRDYCGLFDLDKWPARNVLEDLGFLRSYAAFEVMESRGDVVFHYKQHFERLSQALAKLRMPVPLQAGEFLLELEVFLEKKIREVVEINRLKSALIYVFVSGGSTNDLFHPSTPSNIFILAKKFSFARFKPDKGLKLKTIPWKREFPEIKTTNYLGAEIALFGVGAMGYDDVLYAPEGVLLETSRANFFIVKTLPNGRVVINTSFLKDENGLPFVLSGVTRQIVLMLSEKRDYLVSESLVLMKHLEETEEAFVVSTTRGVWPVVKIDRIDLAIGPITMKLRKEFLKYRRNYFENRGVVDKK